MNNAEVQDLQNELDDCHHRLNDAICVLIGLGIVRRKCSECERLTVTDGFVCWFCGSDNSMDEEE